MLYARIVVILILTLGFLLHNFVLRVAAASASECVLVLDQAAGEDSGQAVPDKPSPSCKVIGASLGAQPRSVRPEALILRPVHAEAGHEAVRPGGPEKPPKLG